MSLYLQRIKSYDNLNIQLCVNQIQQVCCTRSLTDEEMFMSNEAFFVRSLLSETGHALKLHII